MRKRSATTPANIAARVNKVLATGDTTPSTTEAERIDYALAKQVPAMERGFTIQTSYGDLRIDAEDAVVFVAVVGDLLQSKLDGTDKSATVKAAVIAPAASLRSALTTITSIGHLVENHTADLCATLELLADSLPAGSSAQRVARVCLDMAIQHEGTHESILSDLSADINAAASQAEVSHE
ncbi:hypothetical protein [Paraburkholderia adhaesiva]|uniref:hypothetical protein n=1 Tax=Paraburkholderia adhaesiva TaxID=2883244 RepID=UPI001F2BF0BB|nr:hypothetical protein [Paraburkholderia adhaesiva]